MVEVILSTIAIVVSVISIIVSAIAAHVANKQNLRLNRINMKARYYEKIFDEYLNNMAIGVANILIMMDCSVIIGGEIVDGIEKYASFMDRALRPSLNLIWTQEHFGTMAEIDSGDIYNSAMGLP